MARFLGFGEIFSWEIAGANDEVGAAFTVAHL